MNVYKKLLIDKEEKKAWIIDHGASGVYIGITEFKLDNEMKPIEKRGACFQGDDLEYGKKTEDELEKFLKYEADDSLVLKLLKKYDCKPSDLIEELQQDSNNFDIVGKSMEDMLDELGMTLEYIDYLYDNELDLAFGEFEPVKEEDNDYEEFEELFENATYSE